MEQYKISQTPKGGSAKPTKPAKPGKRKTLVPKRRSTQSLDPQLILISIVLILILVSGGVVWAMKLNKKSPATANGNVTTVKKGGKGIPSQTVTAVTGAIGDKQPGALNKYYASSVHVVVKGHSYNVKGSQVQGLIGNLINGAQNPWNWHPSAGQIAAWQTGPYGQYFTGNDIIGISSDGTVVSIQVNDGGQITTVFVGSQGDLTQTGSTGSTSTGTTGGSTGTTSGGSSTSTSTGGTGSSGTSGSNTGGFSD